MTKLARVPAAALLMAVLAVPASLHASGLPASRPAAVKQAAKPLVTTSVWSFDWLRRALSQVLPLTGPGLDPSGGTSSVKPAPGSSVDTGGGLDPSGGS
jgi:hypothetical protein